MRLRLSSVLGLVFVTALAVHCTFNPGPPTGSSITPGSGSAAHPGAGQGGTGAAGTTGYSGACTGLQCQQSTCTMGSCSVPACAAGARTTVSGTVFDPAGKVPLYGITVYVPNKPLAPIADGPSCDPCDLATGTSLLSGSPVAVTKTDVKGQFQLGLTGGDVPAGDNIPLVIQVGKWQRQVTIPHVTACMDNAMTDANLTRLPRSQSEGHIPKMALTTGQKDAMECLLRKIGIADTEFTTETGTGRVNFYAGGGGTASYATTFNAGAAFTPANPWWDSLDNLKKYDIVLHSCEGSYGSYDGNNPPMSTKSPAALKALQDFADLGGRVFASHWHAYWFEKGTPAFQSIATFNHRDGIPNPYDATIDQSFAGGQALASWMVNVGGSTVPGMVTLAQDASNRLVDAVAGSNISERWIYASTLTPQSVQYMSATTPIPGGTCGRVVLSDIHVSAGAVGSDMPATPFPGGCITTDLSPQEKVIEFMLFDIAACVQAIIP
jgi:hypothetical protein